ncbi:hypothetical protein [Arthrospiribacter ruber]|uniref:Uncharacterized protein n=1 Tax=Arthrospiribacter ruber TaxID=2487934 RepID=A0A951MAD2_9BACT|nr:hypothetical protein [Arthrospiribacter ruber]MBW3466257.1 hypothetical protein [Arthrospiribacter ruber]
MEPLNQNELFVLSGGGFAYDVGCGLRYAGNFLAGYFSSGGPSNPNSIAMGVIVAEAKKCPS